MSDTPEMRPTDGGKNLLLRETLRPASMNPADVLQEIAAKLEELREKCPPGCFIKYLKVDCDGLRGGVPRGRRVFLNVVFQKFPEPTD